MEQQAETTGGETTGGDGETTDGYTGTTEGRETNGEIENGYNERDDDRENSGFEKRNGESQHGFGERYMYTTSRTTHCADFAERNGDNDKLIEKSNSDRGIPVGFGDRIAGPSNGCRDRNGARHGSWSYQVSIKDDLGNAKPNSPNTGDIDRSRHASRASSSSSESSSTPSVRAPDGEWGWMVVFGSFLCHLIADGCAFSFGVLYVELLDYFGESKGKTAWVGSLFVSIPLITGPIASAVTNRYGCRVTTIAGSIIATIGFVTSSQVHSIEMLCFTFGIIAGFGLSMVYVPAVVIVAYYFEKKRAFATGKLKLFVFDH